MRRVLLVLLAFLAAAAPASAASGPAFGLRALGNAKLGYFVYPAPAGSVVRGAIAVTNTGDARGTVRLFGADATTGRTTGAVYLTDDPPRRAGAWIRLAKSRLTLAPHGRARVPFTVTVPAGAGPGQWVGGIVAETMQTVAGPKSKRKTNVQIRVRNLSIVAVQVNVPGPVTPRFTVGRVAIGGSKGFQQVIVHVANVGNSIAKPSGSVVVSKTSGEQVEKVDFSMDTFLPQSAIDYPVPLKKALPPGSYVASVSLSYPGAPGGRITAAPRFDVSKQDVAQVFRSAKPTQPPTTPVASGGESGGGRWKWVVLALGLLLLLGGAVFAVVRRSRREPAADPCVPYHYWEPDYDRGLDGPGGIRRFPHRCRNCGLEVMAADVDDATAQAEALRR